jgi:hypothetical protein
MILFVCFSFWLFDPARTARRAFCLLRIHASENLFNNAKRQILQAVKHRAFSPAIPQK